MKFFAIKHKTEDLLIAWMEDDTVGLVSPGYDANYYKYIMFWADFERSQYIPNVQKYLEQSLPNLPQSDEYPFKCDELKVVEFIYDA